MMSAYVRKIGLVSLLACVGLVANVGSAAIVITGQVTPADIDITTSQPTAELVIGNTSDGTLEVNGGSTIVTSEGLIGVDEGISGTLTVTGAGSSWTIQNASGQKTIIGQQGDGTLEILDGAVVNNLGSDPSTDPYSIEVGFSDTGTGTINVDGAGSTLNTDTLIVGRLAGTTANLNITNGGTVNVENFNLGQQGTVNMNIDGGSLIVAGDTYIGVNGSGTATIENGGSIQTGGDALINSGTGDVEVTVTGAGTSWDVTGDLNVGEDGTLNIEDDADVSVGNDLIIQDGAVVDVEAGTSLVVGNEIVVEQGGLLDLESGADLVTDINVESDGTYQGSGSVSGDVSVAGLMWDSTTVAGQTLDIKGGYTLASGGTLTVNIDSDTGDFNTIAVSGTAVLEDGSTVSVNVQGSGFIADGTTFDVITADSVDDQGTEVIDDSAFLKFNKQVVTGTSGEIFQLYVSQTARFSQVALGRNNLSMARSLDYMSTAGTATARQDIMLGQLQLLNASQFNAAMQQMTPEQYIAFGRDLPNRMETFHRDLGRHLSDLRNGYTDGASGELASKGAALDMRVASTDIDPETLAAVIEEQQEQEMREEALTDSASATNTKWSVWGQISNNWDKQKSTNDLVGWNNRTWNVTSGVDRQITEGIRIGALLGYSRSEFHFRDSRGHLDVDSLRVGPYMDWNLGSLFVEASLTFGYHWNDAKRNINFPGFSDSSKAKYESWDLSPYARIGYTFDVAGWKLTPSMALQYVYYSQESFHEHGGSGATALAMDKWSQNSLRQMFMFEVSKLFDLQYVKLIPAFMAGYSLEYLGDQSMSYSFISQSYPMTFWPGETGGNRMLWGTSLTALLSDDLAVFIRYDGSAGSRNINQSLSGGVRVKF